MLPVGFATGENYQEINSDAARNLAACRRYAESWEDVLANGTSLVLTGSCGTGKNHLAVAMAEHIIRNHLASVEITDVMRLTRAVKNCWRNDETKERRMKLLSIMRHWIC